jgi:hypothetical protein
MLAWFPPLLAIPDPLPSAEGIALLNSILTTPREIATTEAEEE